MNASSAIKMLAPGMLAVAIGGLSSGLYAQEIGFADDFSVDSTRYSTHTFSDTTGRYTIDYVDEALRLTASGDGTRSGNIILSINNVTDRFQADVSLSSESVFSEQSTNGRSAVYVEGTFYNDIAENSNNSVHEGDVFVNIELLSDQDRNLIGNYCMNRIDSSGNSMNLGEYGSAYCNSFEGSETLEFDKRYRVSIELDRAASELNLALGDLSETIAIAGDIFNPLWNQNRVRVQQFGDAGTAVALVHAVNTDTFNDDFSRAEPVYDRYRSYNFSGTNNSIDVENGVARIFATTDDPNGYEGNELWLKEPGDYIEATVNMASESVVSADDSESESRIIMKLVAYNDIQDGGLDGEMGDVEARIEFRARANGRRSVEYCLFRSDDAEFHSSSGLLENGDDCEHFPLLFEMDKDYRIAIGFDRTDKTVSFRVDGFILVHQIEASIFSTNHPRIYVGAVARNRASSVVYVDNLRTDPNALTISEISDGFDTPAPFPDAPNASASLSESQLSGVQPFSVSLDFIDDFTSNTTLWGVWNGRTRGESTVGFEDNALVLQANSVSDDAEAAARGNYNEISLGGEKTDSLTAVVSLSSDSAISTGSRPEGGGANSNISINLRAINETQDGGFEGDTGDIELRIQVGLAGDGARSFGFDIRRRLNDGGSERVVKLRDLEAFSELRNYIPQLDTPYKLSIQLDRETGIITFGIDDLEATYQLDHAAYYPFRHRAGIEIWHSGPGGRVIGKVHSIETDSLSEDFSDGPPLIPPYATSFDTQYAGVNVTHENGRVRLDADSSITDGRDPRIRVLGDSDFIGSTVELSSESTVSDNGEIFVGVSARLYNDVATGGFNGNEGLIFGSLRVFARGSGTGDGSVSRAAEYCAYRSNDADWGDVSELIGGDPEQCLSFDTVPEFDTPYSVSIELDKKSALIRYKFADEVKEFNIPGSIFDEGEPFRQVNARATGGSQVVAYMDDLSVAAAPVPLAQSQSLLSASVDGAPLHGDTTGDSSGGGCSIGGSGAKDPALAILALLSILGLISRRMRLPKV